MELIKCWETKNCPDDNNCPAKTSELPCFMLENVCCKVKRTVATCIGCPVLEEYVKIMRLSTFDYIAENRCPQIATFDPNPGLHQLPKVLIIEDLSIRISQRGILERGEKIHVTNAIDYEESLRTLQERNFQYVILDIRFSEKAEKKRNAPFGLIVRALLKLAGYPDDRIIITSDDKKICKMIMQNSDHPMGNKLEGAKHVLDQIRATLGNNAPQAPSPDLRSSPAPAA